jgi:hypothetical protein
MPVSGCLGWDPSGINVLPLKDDHRGEGVSGRVNAFDHRHPLLLTHHDLVLLLTVEGDQDLRGLTLSDPKTGLIHILDVRIVVDALLEFRGNRVKPGLHLIV